MKDFLPSKQILAGVSSPLFCKAPNFRTMNESDVVVRFCDALSSVMRCGSTCLVSLHLDKEDSGRWGVG